MQDRPRIQTAIPKRRYQIGDYSATLLGEIQSPDEVDYRYILAFVRMGEPEPVCYLCAEQVAPADSPDGKYRLRLINEAMSEEMDQDDRWGDLDHFAEQALQLGVQALGLHQEQPFRLL